jgi:ribosomal protein L7/L12
MSDDRTVKVTIERLGDFYVTAREAQGLVAMLRAMRTYDLESGRTIEVTLHDAMHGKQIQAIKAVRQLTGWDLKTSKEAWDRRPIKLRVDAGKVPEIEQVLQDHEVIYSGLSVIERIAKMEQTK